MAWVQIVRTVYTDISITTTMSQDQDNAVVQLLELLDRYEKVANDSFRLKFISGIQHLSRANFNSDGRKYGTDSLDRRPYDACKVVETQSGFTLVDKLKKQRTESASLKVVLEKEEVLEKKDVLESLRQRKNKKTEKTGEALGSKKKGAISEINNSPALRDPIYQFGVLVPYQLRDAQASFNDSLSDIVEMVNLRQQITEAVKKIEATEVPEKTGTE